MSCVCRGYYSTIAPTPDLTHFQTLAMAMSSVLIKIQHITISHSKLGYEQPNRSKLRYSSFFVQQTSQNVLFFDQLHHKCSATVSTLHSSTDTDLTQEMVN